MSILHWGSAYLGRVEFKCLPKILIFRFLRCEELRDAVQWILHQLIFEYIERDKRALQAQPTEFFREIEECIGYVCNIETPTDLFA